MKFILAGLVGLLVMGPIGMIAAILIVGFTSAKPR